MPTKHRYDTSVHADGRNPHAIVHSLEAAERERRRSGVPVAPHDDGRNDEKLIAMWLHGKATGTKKEYLRDVRRFLGYVHDELGDDVGLPLVTLRELVGFAGTLEDLAAATQIRKLACIKSLLSFAAKLQYCEQNIGAMFQLPKSEDDLHERIIPRSHVDRLIRAAASERDEVLLETLYKTGIRVGEAEQLRWKAFREQRGGRVVVTVRGKGEKTRRILVSPKAWRALREIMPVDLDESMAVFPSRQGTDEYGHRPPLERTQIWRIVKKAAKKAGLDPRVSTHWLRHAHASHALDAGAPIHVVQHDLGHTSLVTTSKYVHVAPNEGGGDYLDDDGPARRKAA